MLESPLDLPLFSSCLIKIREWEEKNLPLSQSRISFDLFLLIACSYEGQQPYTLKEIFNSLNYSQRGVRYVLDQMINQGWCILIENDLDKRFKFVVGTDLMGSKLLEYKMMVMSMYKDISDDLHSLSINPKKIDIKAQNELPQHQLPK
jgi:hypothetical protein